MPAAWAVGPSLGEELRRGALIALALALAAQLVYLAVRFRWTFSAGAVAALAANVTIVVGVFAWLGKPLDGVFLAALLTVIGYTVNDSVVVFDRIREAWAGRPARLRRAPFHRVVGRAVLATLPRTVNTGLSTMLILAALLVERRLDQRLPAISKEAELVLYRIAQESLTNIARHAGASRVDLELTGRRDGVVLHITDNGRGLAGSAEGAGIRGMRERALLIGAKLTLGPAPTTGTEMRLVVPVRAQRG